MNNQKNKKICIHKNLAYLRKLHGLSLEEVAEKIGVTRQAAAKWENGESIPDIINCDALADLYDVRLDDLLHFDGEKELVGIAPKGKYMFGTTKIGERGQVVIPKQARDTLNLKIGDTLVVLGEEETSAIALMPSHLFMQAAKAMMDNFYPKDSEGQK